jgi:hypothetical protein
METKLYDGTVVPAGFDRVRNGHEAGCVWGYARPVDSNGHYLNLAHVLGLGCSCKN